MSDRKPPVRYSKGDPATNLLLAILRTAKEDDAQMWIDFKGTELYQNGVDGRLDILEVAWWVVRYIKKIQPEEVEVELDGEVAVMSMDDFKELIGGLNETSACGMD